MIHSWKDELREIKSRFAKTDIRKSDHILHTMMRNLPHEPLLIFYPDITAKTAYDKMTDRDVEFSLIQESADTLLGVLSKHELETVLTRDPSTEPRHNGQLAVRSIMGRNICIEPETASLLEVMDRMTMGSCACAVIVNNLGHPRSIATPQSVVRLLSRSEPFVTSPAKVA